MTANTTLGTVIIRMPNVSQATKKGNQTQSANAKKSATPQTTHLLEGEEKALSGEQDSSAYSLFNFDSKHVPCHTKFS